MVCTDNWDFKGQMVNFKLVPENQRVNKGLLLFVGNETI